MTDKIWIDMYFNIRVKYHMNTASPFRYCIHWNWTYSSDSRGDWTESWEGLFFSQLTGSIFLKGKSHLLNAACSFHWTVLCVLIQWPYVFLSNLKSVVRRGCLQDWECSILIYVEIGCELWMFETVLCWQFTGLLVLLWFI